MSTWHNLNGHPVIYYKFSYCGSVEILGMSQNMSSRAALTCPPILRSFAKYTLVMFMGQDEDLDRVLKKNLTPNTMRNLEKILDALR